MSPTKKATIAYLEDIEGRCIRMDFLFPAYCIPVYAYKLRKGVYSIDQVFSLLVIDIAFELYIKNDHVPIREPILPAHEERELTPFFVFNYALKLYKKNYTLGDFFDFHEVRIFFEEFLAKIIPGIRGELAKGMMGEVMYCYSSIYSLHKRKDELHYLSVLYDVLFDRGYFLAASQVDTYRRLTKRNHELNRLFANLVLHLALDKYNNNGDGISKFCFARINGFDNPKNMYKTSLDFCPPSRRESVLDLHGSKEIFEEFLESSIPGINKEDYLHIPVLTIL